MLVITVLKVWKLDYGEPTTKAININNLKQLRVRDISYYTEIWSLEYNIGIKWKID